MKIKYIPITLVIILVLVGAYLLFKPIPIPNIMEWCSKKVSDITIGDLLLIILLYCFFAPTPSIKVINKE